MTHHHFFTARLLLMFPLLLEGVLINIMPGSAFVAPITAQWRCTACGVVPRNDRKSSMYMRVGGGGQRLGDTAVKALAVGLVGLQFWALPGVAVPHRRLGAPLARLEIVNAATAAPRREVDSSTSKSDLTVEEELIEEVEKLELKTEVEGDLKKQSKKKPGPLPNVFQTPKKGSTVPRVELMEIPQTKLTASVGTIQGLAPYLDEVEYLITARNWDYLKGFLGVFASCEGDFVDLIDGMYPTTSPSDVSARDSMQLEAQNVFLAVDDLYMAAMSKKPKGAEKAYVKLALAYDRFMKAGNIVERYDPISSTEKFFNDIPDEMLRYDRDSKIPLEVRDAVLILKGPDKGRTGRLVGIIKSRNEGIVRIDGKVREMRILELTDIARQLPDDRGPASKPKSSKK